MKLRSADSLTRWWYDVLESGTVKVPTAGSDPIPKEISDTDNTVIEKTQLYAAYVDSAKTQGDKFLLAPSNFSKELKNLVFFQTTKLRVGERAIGKKRRRNCYMFPLLSECRTSFEKAAKLNDYNWDDEA